MEHRPPSCIVVTGASSGLGAGLARAYAAPGVIMALTGRDQARLDSVAAACRAQGARVSVACIDVRDRAAMAHFLVDFDVEHQVDLVIANAGIAHGSTRTGELESHAEAVRQIEVNLLGTVNSLAPLLPAMQTRRAGHIAVVASVASYRGLADSPAYCASKAGVRLYGESLRGALARDGVAVSVVVPGFFASPMSERFIGAQPMALPLEDMVRRVVAGLARRQARIVVPRTLGVLLQVTDLLPAWLGDAILDRYRFHIARPPSTRP